MPEFSEQGLEALEQAQKELPDRWYDDHDKCDDTIVAGGFILGLLIAAGEIRLGYSYTQQLITEGSASSAIALASCIADERSTVKLFDAASEAKNKGIPANFQERNTVTGPVTNSEDFKKVKKRHLVNAAFLITSAIWPLGLPLSIGKFGCALTNRRNRLMVNRAMEIMDSKSQS
jgi:hypothetical protein